MVSRATRSKKQNGAGCRADEVNRLLVGLMHTFESILRRSGQLSDSGVIRPDERKAFVSSSAWNAAVTFFIRSFISEGWLTC
jgi:hypothetical protein